MQSRKDLFKGHTVVLDLFQDDLMIEYNEHNVPWQGCTTRLACPLIDLTLKTSSLLIIMSISCVPIVQTIGFYLIL